MTVPFWGTTDGAKSWDTVYISGVAAPGVAKVSGKGFEQKLDVKKVKGSSRTILRFEGQDAAEFTITLRIWTEAQLKDLVDLILRIKPKKGTAPSAFDVAHPALECFGIRQMYVQSAPLPQEGEKGIYEVSLSCMEFLPLPKGGSGKSKSQKPETDPRTLDNESGRRPMGLTLDQSAKNRAASKDPANDPTQSGP